MSLREKWNQVGFAVFNVFVTHVPSHTIRLATLRAWGAQIGERTSIGRGTTVIDIHRLRVGSGCSIGFRCMLDARGGIDIGDDVAMASDTHIVTARHEVDSDTFEAVFRPVVIGDHAWISSRATIVDGVTIGRGAVVAACALVRASVDEMQIVGGVPARVLGVRTSSLDYTAEYRRRFY